ALTLTLTETTSVVDESIANSTNVVITAGTADTITRSGGSWINDGFMVGDTITVTGTASSDGTYHIASMSATVLTLVETRGLHVETLNNAGQTSVAGPGTDTITRSAGSWVTEGYQAGQSITVTGTAGNNGTYEIIGVTATTLTLFEKNSVTDA